MESFYHAAYREGVVIAKCKGCDSNHMLADNLGWGAFHEGETNIEEYLKGKGMEVSRVSPEVFDLEKVLGIDSSGGSLVGDDGSPVLE
jgi:3D (Asp-Asp-Asp) domain-containing protein